MSETKITFYIYRDIGHDKLVQAGGYASEMAAREAALRIQDREPVLIEIRSEIVTTTTVDSFTVPAYVPTIEEIAQDIINGSDGSFYLEWSEDYENLDAADRAIVEDMVHEEISSCDVCGWYFRSSDMSNIDGQLVCYKCEEDIQEEEEDNYED